MYAFKENKDALNHNLDILELLYNLYLDAIDAIEYFKPLLTNQEEEKKLIFKHAKHGLRDHVNIKYYLLLK